MTELSAPANRPVRVPVKDGRTAPAQVLAVRGSARPTALPVRQVVAKSWKRCRVAGMTPEDLPPAPVVPALERNLVDYRDTHPLMHLLPIARDLLGTVVRDSGCIFSIADSHGVLLWVDGNAQTRRLVEQIHFVEGADWSERAAGTNAPGTSLAIGGPVRIIGDEHFNCSVRWLSCSAVPIRDPGSGRLVGVIDVTGGAPAGSGPMLGLVRATARTLETELSRRLAIRDLQTLEAHFHQLSSPPDGAALVGPSGRVLAASSGFGATNLSGLTGSDDLLGHRSEGRRLVVEPIGVRGYFVARFVEGDDAPLPRPLRLQALGRDCAQLDIDGRELRLGPRHSEIVMLLTASEEGLTTETLSVALSSQSLSPTTIRVDINRLRAQLGEGLPAARPYHLLRAVRSDWSAVADLLAERRTADALNAYPGPLLPHSQAPGIIRMRQQLHQSLRQAVLASYDAKLVAQWLDTPWGTDDAVGWDTLAGLYQEGSPRRAQATARADAARRRASEADAVYAEA